MKETAPERLVVPVSFPMALVERLDLWRKEQTSPPKRSAAIADLVRVALDSLKAPEPQPMKKWVRR